METLDIIVLGFDFKDPRAMDNPQLAYYIYHSRLDTAFRLYLENLNPAKPRIIITGGDVASLGKSEAQIGFDYLLANYCEQHPGIWQDTILEEQARGTLGNAVYTKLILLANGTRTPLIVSSDWHINNRVRCIFNYVYGEEFQPQYIGSPTNLDKEILDKIMQIEAESLRSDLRFFDENRIRIGDHETILKILKRNQQTT